MTISNNLCTVTYIGDGSTTEFIIPFDFFSDEITVFHNQTFNQYIKDIDYTITNTSGTNNAKITFTTAPTSGIYITINRAVPLNQLVTFIEGEDFPASDYEYSLDRIYMIFQQISEQLSRALLAPPGATSPIDSFYTKNELYTKSEVDALLNAAFDETNYYTKSEIDAMIGIAIQQLSEV